MRGGHWRAFAAPRVAVLAVLGATLTAASAQDQDGVYKGIEQTVRERVIILGGSSRYPIPQDVYERILPILQGLSPGDHIVFRLDANGRLADLRRATSEGGDSNRRRNITGRYERLLETRTGDGPQRYLVLGSGQRSLISEERYSAFQRVLTFLTRGDAIRVTVEGGWVQELTTTRLDAPQLDPALEDEILQSVRGDIVTVNGELFRFMGSNLQELRLQPRIRGPGPPQFLDQGEIKLEIGQVRSFENPRVRGQAATQPDRPAEDACKDVRVGDTVGIDFKVGQVVALTETTFTWREWRNDEWVAPETLDRAAIKAIAVVSLPLQQTIQVEGGELQLDVSRRRSERDGLTFEVQLLHAIPGVILSGAKLRFLLGDLTMATGSGPQATEEVALPPLFEGQLVKVQHTPRFEQAFDGIVEAVVPAESRISVTSPRAREYLIKALEDVTSSNDLEAQTRACQAVGRNGDRELVLALVGRAMAETEPAKRVPTIAGLVAAGTLTPTVVMAELLTGDRDLRAARLAQGQVRRIPLPNEERPVSYKRRLIGLLSEVSGALGPPYGGQLFDVLRSRDDLAEPIELAFAARPAEAVASLLDVATSTNSASTDDAKQRAERAAALLQKLGQAVLEEIVRELRRRDIPVDMLARPGARASEVVGQALAALIDDAVRKRRAAHDQRVAQAEQVAEQKKWSEAADVLRQVLVEDRGHGPALEAFPGVLERLAEERRTAGDRTGAGACYAEAIAWLPERDQGRVRTILAELYLEAVGEELEASVIRAAPDDLAQVVRPARVGETLRATDSRGWVELALPADARGYIRVKCLALAQNEGWVVRDPATPLSAIEPVLKKVADLAPDLQRRCAEIRGKIYAREAAALYEAGEYQAALTWFADASKLAPTDERLGLQWSCWLRAYQMHFLSFVALIAALTGIALYSTFARPKRVKWVGDYKHYGSERAQRERDLEVDEAAGAAGAPGVPGAPPAEGAAPQAPPPDAAGGPPA